MADRKLTIGAVEIVALTDAEAPFPLAQVFPGVEAARWAPYRERYPECFADAGIWRSHFGSYLVRAPGRTILVDTGIGPGPVAGLGGAGGALPAALRDRGIDPVAIDTVVMTHLHVDHVGWNLTAEGQPLFPGARYVAGRADWDLFGRPEARASAPYIDRTLTPLADLGLLDLLPGGEEMALTDTGEVRAFPTPGHTPGHLSVLIASGGRQALIGGDVIVHPAQVAEPRWAFIADGDQEASVVTRRTLLDRLEAEGSILLAGHFPAPGFGRVVRDGDAHRWEPL